MLISFTATSASVPFLVHLALQIPTSLDFPTAESPSNMILRTCSPFPPPVAPAAAMPAHAASGSCERERQTHADAHRKRAWWYRGEQDLAYGM